MEEKDTITTVSESGSAEAVVAAPEHNYKTTGFAGWLNKYFKLQENKTTIKVEIIAGITTFMTMAYILMVNAGIFSDLGVSYGAIYIATAISAIIGTVLIGLLAKLPLAQASGMGLNAFFVYTVCFQFGFTYANALVFVLIDGIVFIILTLLGIREKIFNAVPKAVRVAIPAGIGLFIAFIGTQNSGLVVPNGATGVSMGSMNLLGSAGWANIMPIVVVIIAVLTIAVLSKKNVKGAILWGILGGAALYYILGLTVSGFYSAQGYTETYTFVDATMTYKMTSSGNLNYFLGVFTNPELSTFAEGCTSYTVTYLPNTLSLNVAQPFADFGGVFGKVFTEGFNFSAYLKDNSVANLILMLITTSLAFCIVDIFDTMGTLFGACSRGNMLDKDGNVPNMQKAMLADAIATCTGAICGTSTVTTFVESSAGIAEGGRTGLTSMIVAAGFLVAMFLAPVAQLIPACATAAALIYVGVLMMSGVRDIDWLDPDIAVPAFLTIAMMVFTYSISFGIGFGIISFVVIKLCTGKAKEVNVLTYVLAAIFIATFLLTH